MIRKQVYITADQDAMLKRLAEARGQTEAEVVRDALDLVNELAYERRTVEPERVREAVAIMDRYVTDNEDKDVITGVSLFQSRRLDSEAWQEEIAFIKRLAQTSRGTTDHFDRDELYEDRISKLLR